jgi:HK97 family phage major capsid protein
MSDNEKRSVPELNYKATVNRQKDIADEIRRVAEKPTISLEDEKYLGELEGEFDELDDHRKSLERSALLERIDVTTGRKAKVETVENDPLAEPRSVGRSPLFHNPWDISEMRVMASPSAKAEEFRGRALSAIEKMSGTNDKRRKVMTSLVEEKDSQDGKLAQQLLATSSPEYTRAFGKFLHGQTANYTPEEAEAVSRAMSLTTTAGGFLVPFQLDPTVIITSDGTYNQTRQMFRNVVATGNVWHGVSSPYAAWSVDGEAAEVSDDATAFLQPSVTIYKIAGFIPISIEALEDEQNVTTEIGRLLAMGKDNFESQLFTTGTGSSQHTGIVGTAGLAALTAASSVITSTTTDTFGLVDVYATDTALPARYRANAGWLMHRFTANTIRQFDTAGGAGLWARVGEGQPDQMLGKPVYESESMNGAITGSGENYLLVYADREAFVIADRVGMVVEPIQHLFGASFRPTGQRGFYAYARSGSNIVNAGGISVLNVT